MKNKYIQQSRRVRHSYLADERSVRAVGENKVAQDVFEVWREDVHPPLTEQLNDLVQQFFVPTALRRVFGDVPLTVAAVADHRQVMVASKILNIQAKYEH